MTGRLRCRAGRHRWVRKQGSPTVVCRDCGSVGRRRKTILCYVGLHSWVTAVNEGERYLECRRCGRYGGSPGSFNWVPNRNRDP